MTDVGIGCVLHVSVVNRQSPPRTRPVVLLTSHIYFGRYETRNTTDGDAEKSIHSAGQHTRQIIMALYRLDFLASKTNS